jgi:hypothetical protein
MLPVGWSVAEAWSLSRGFFELGPEDVDLGVREVGKPAAMVDIEVGEHDVTDVGSRESLSLDLPYRGLRFVKDRLSHRDPVGTEALVRVAYVLQAEPGLNEYKAVVVRLHQEAVVDGAGRGRTGIGGLDLAHGAAVQMMDVHA